ncbi:hypothetical protein C7B77_18885 [Chamaesiphon polymorphus CCALA 037]|uniref:Uncharacterized protein n=1 Tax=Chamaesiphon polymorphus CCALA 037 TaxID=2107692 RepID=A0A2T1GAJ4_9CYAN|nr:hypothetical protein C7B77_18885 [Chamaesiphon polymorphus CCALA 037]
MIIILASMCAIEARSERVIPNLIGNAPEPQPSPPAPLPSLGEGSQSRRIWRGEGDGTVLVIRVLHESELVSVPIFDLIYPKSRRSKIAPDVYKLTPGQNSIEIDTIARSAE